MNFYPDFFNPENFEGTMSAIGCAENDLESRVWDMVEDLKYRCGLCVPAWMVTEELQRRGIPYEMLPPHIKDIIDELDVY